MVEKINQLKSVTERILDSYRKVGGINNLHGTNLPSRDGVIDIIKRIETLLFPGFFQQERIQETNLEYVTGNKVVDVYERLVLEIQRNLEYDSRNGAVSLPEERALEQARSITEDLLEELPVIREALQLDVRALFDGDPASRSEEEVILSYPGLRAVTVHRIAHFLWGKGAGLIARMMSEYIHSRTGIDIHPGAKIGAHFYIDHGTGVVIGETTVIGDHVKIYQGVSLGALSVSKKLQNTRRHPMIEDHVTIYAGATILGGDTVIGHNSVIGGNVWLVMSVPPYSVVENDPRVNVIPRTQREETWYYHI